MSHTLAALRASVAGVEGWREYNGRRVATSPPRSKGSWRLARHGIQAEAARQQAVSDAGKVLGITDITDGRFEAVFAVQVALAPPFGPESVSRDPLANTRRAGQRVRFEPVAASCFEIVTDDVWML